MNSTRICFRRMAAGIALGLVLFGCRAVRESRSESLRARDSVAADHSLSEIAIDTAFATCRFKEIRFTEFYPPDSSLRDGPPRPHKQLVVRCTDTKNEKKTQSVRLAETLVTHTAERRQTVEEESPGKDPYRWRYMFYTACLLSLVGTVCLARKIMR